MSQVIPPTILEQVEEKLQVQVGETQRISGGCIHHTFRLKLSDGTPLFLKFNHPEAGGNFEIEARGLRQLEATETLKVPSVRHVGRTEQHAYLLLDWVEQGRQSRSYWSEFGARLARLHQHTQPTFGLEYANYIGALPQENDRKADWATFFIEQRIEPMVRMATQREYFERRTLQRFDRLSSRLEGLFPDEPPALLHGDLWGGNILVGLDGSPVLIDPAIYYGHREMELAFMTLFDKQPSSFYEAYEEVYPLAEDWRSRVDLCNLYPLLVHVNLFGGGYVQAAERILYKYT